MKIEIPKAAHLGQILRRLRADAGLTQGELAARASLAVATVSSMENGGRWTLENMDAVAVALGTSGSALLQQTEAA